MSHTLFFALICHPDAAQCSTAEEILEDMDAKGAQRCFSYKYLTLYIKKYRK